MTGPECYQEALRLVQAKPGRVPSLETTAVAQVFATLALAAATALGREGGDSRLPDKDRTAWFDVAAECKKEAAR